MISTILLTIPALAQILGPFLADFNHTHVLNPNWPPHARFHNGQTMSTGLALGLSSLYYTYRPFHSSWERREFLFVAALLGSIYWVTALSAILYPGSKAVDPEFGEGFPQFGPFVAFTAAAWLGWWIGVTGLTKAKVR